MGDNRLNLVVQFLGIDKLSPALKNMIGLGKTGRQELATLTAEQRRLNGEIATYDKRISQTTGSVTHLWNAQKKLLTQQEAIGAQIQRQKNLMAIDGRTARTQAKGSAMVGSGTQTLFMGAMLAAPLYEMAKLAGQAQAADNQLRALGLDDQSVGRLEDNARRAKIAGASYLDMMRYTVEAQGAFRESGALSVGERTNAAILMAPMMAKLAVANKAMGREMSEDQEKYFLRFIEMGGGLNSPARAAQLTDGLFRALGSSGNTLQASDFQEFLSNAGSAGRTLTARSIFADNEPIIQMLGGKTAGAGLGMAYRMATGIKTNSKAAAEYLRLGLWNKNNVVFNKLGGIKSTKGNPLKGDAMNALSDSPIDFYKNFILPEYFKHGIVTEQQRNFENARLFGTSGSKYYGQVDATMGKVLNSRQSFEKAQSLDKAYNGTKDSFFGQTGQMTAAWKDFLVVAGGKGGLLQNLTAGLRGATSALKSFTAFGNAHPTAFKWILGTVTALLGFKLAMAALKIVFGGLLGPAGQIWGLFSKYWEFGSLAAMFPKVAKAFGILRTAALFLGQGMLRAGAMMLANPMVLLIVGIGVAIGVVAYLVYKHWDTIKKAFWSGWAWVKNLLSGAGTWLSNIGHAMMNGLLNALNPMLLAHRLLDVARTGMAAFKNYFGIKSPSRLMMEMGGFMTQGLGQGVDRGAHRPLRSMARLATGMAGALAAGTAGAAHARTTVHHGDNHYHIYQRPGEDSHHLAKRIAKIVQNDRLSSYQDDF